MVAGDLLTRPYQYEFRTLLFGSGTDFITEKVSGLHGMPGVTDSDINRSADHGAFPGVLLMNKRTLAFDMKIVGEAGEAIERKLAIARETFQVPRVRYGRVMDPFVFWRPGEPKKVLYVRCTKRDFPSDYETARGLSSGSVELVAPDPVIQSVVVHHEEATIGAAVLNANLVCTMNGDFRDGARPIVTITGPWNNPRILNTEDDSRTLRLDLSLAAVDALRLTYATRKIEVRRGLNGAWVDGYIYRRSDNQWWTLLPGVNHITATRASTNSGANGKVEVDWQDAYA